jgi:PAS domain S-box-containing protein
MKDYKQILEVNDSFNRMFMESPLWQIVLDNEGKIILPNKSLCKILGIEQDAVHGKMLKDLCETPIYQSNNISDLIKKVSDKKEDLISVSLELNGKRGKIKTLMTICSYELKDKALPGTLLSFINQDSESKLCDDDRLTGKFSDAAGCFPNLEKNIFNYQLIAQSTSDVFWSMDLDLNQLYVSPTIKDLREYTDEEHLSQPITEIFTAKSITKLKKIIKTGLENEKKPRENSGPSRIELEYKRKDGLIAPAEVNTTFLKDKQDKIIGVCGITRDLTQQKKTQKALRESEEKYKLLADNISDVIYLIDMNFDMVYTSPSQEKVFGYTVEEAINQDVKDILTPRSYKVLVKAFAEELEKEKDPNKDTDRTRVIQIEQYHKDGHLMWTEEHMQFIRDDNANPIAILGISRDISERKKAEKEIIESEERLRLLSDAAIEGILIHSDGVTIDINKSAQEMFGYKRSEIIGTDPINLISPAERKKVWGKIVSHTVGLYETLGIKKDKTQFPIEISPTEIPFRGSTVRVAAVRDISEKKKTLEALKESEKKYKAIFDYSPEAILVISTDGTITECNKEIENLFGFQKEVLIGKNFLDINKTLDEEYQELYENLFEKLISGELKETFNIKAFNANGDEMWIEAYPSFFKRDLEPEAILIILRDITKSIKAENAMKEAQARFNAIFNGAIDAVYLHNEKGEFIDANKSALDMLGYEREDIPHLNFAKLIADEEQIMKAVNDLREILTEGASNKVYEYKLRRKDNSVINIETSMVVLHKDGASRHLLGIARDITESKTIMAKLKELSADFESERDKLRNMLDNMAEAVILSDENDNILDVNLQGEGFMGEERKKAVGKPLFECVPSMIHESINEMLGKLKNDNKKFASAKHNIKGLWVDVRVSPVPRAKGKYKGAIFNMVDVTSLVNAQEKAESASRAKSQFLANMSHEIRTPMNAILGFAELLKNSEINNKQTHYIQTIQKSGQHLLHLINQVLDHSRIEAGRAQLEFAIFSPQDLVGEVIEMIKPEAKKKGVIIEAEISGKVPQAILADENRIKQVLVNLAGNAAKFTENGFIKINVIIENKNIIVFSVKDTGQGIPKHKQDKIFKAFEQIDSSLTRKHDGTGLGLAISARLVELMKGNIKLISEQGKGSEFVVKIPVETDLKSIDYKNYIKSETEDENKQKKNEDKKKHVLIIDDEPTVREVLKEMLDKFGLKGLEAENGNDGILRAQLHEPDAIILDVELPDRSGMDILEDLKSDELTKEIPIIMCSVLDKDADMRETKAESWLAKPFSMESLGNELENIGLKIKKISTNKKETKIIETDNYLKNRKTKILLIEDNPLNRKVVKAYLNHPRFAILEAENGKEGLAMLEKNIPDIILMDIAMPIMDGIEATIEIKKDHKYEDVPIIALTAAAMDEDREKCIEAGCNDYLTKPVNRKKLIDAIEKMLLGKDKKHEVING